MRCLLADEHRLLCLGVGLGSGKPGGSAVNRQSRGLLKLTRLSNVESVNGPGGFFILLFLRIGVQYARNDGLCAGPGHGG